MSDAVGLKDVFSYGLRFVGYLSLVVLVGGGLLVAGNEFGFRVILDAEPADLLNPSQLNVSTTYLVLSAGFTIVGAVTLASGLVGVLHKLITDAAMTGTEMALAADTEAEGGTAGGTTPAEDLATESNEVEPDTAEPTPDAPEPAEDGPVVDEPQDDTAVAEPGPAADDSAPVAQAGSSEPLGPEPASEAASSPTTETRLVENDPGQSEESDNADDDSDLIAEADEDETGTAEAPPEEWSPPDPSEFDEDESAKTTDDDAAPDTATDGPEDDTPRTAADLFDDTGTEDEETDSESDPLSDALDDE